MEITPERDDIVNAYNWAVNDAETLSALRDVMEEFKPLTIDALDLVSHWTEEDFAEFRRHLPAMRQTEEEVDDEIAEKYQCVIIPMAMFIIGAAQGIRGTSFGTTFLLLQTSNAMRVENGQCVFSEKFVEWLIALIGESDDAPPDANFAIPRFIH